jgi:hypothetical protein
VGVARVLDGLLTVSPSVAYLLIVLAVFGEAAIFIGCSSWWTAVVMAGPRVRQKIDIVACVFSWCWRR